MADLWRGHRVEIRDGACYYSDTGEPTATTARRPCGHCGLEDTPEGHDGCLGTLDESIVMNACCGHGDAEHAYIQFWGGQCIRGDTAQKYIEELMNE